MSIYFTVCSTHKLPDTSEGFSFILQISNCMSLERYLELKRLEHTTTDPFPEVTMVTPAVHNASTADGYRLSL